MNLSCQRSDCQRIRFDIPPAASRRTSGKHRRGRIDSPKTGVLLAPHIATKRNPFRMLMRQSSTEKFTIPNARECPKGIETGRLDTQGIPPHHAVRWQVHGSTTKTPGAKPPNRAFATSEAEVARRLRADLAYCRGSDRRRGLVDQAPSGAGAGRRRQRRPQCTADVDRSGDRRQGRYQHYAQCAWHGHIAGNRHRAQPDQRLFDQDRFQGRR